MKSTNVKWPIIIFCSFVFLCAISMIYINRKYANEFVTYNDELVLGDTKSSCATKDYDKCKCDSMGPGRDYCRKQCGYCKTCGSDSELHSDGYCYKKSTSTPKPSTSNLKLSISGKSTIGIAQNVGSVSVIYTLKDSKGSFIKGSWTVSGSGVKTSNCSNSSTCTVTFTHQGTSCPKRETQVTITAKASGKSATYKVNVNYFSAWKKTTGRWEFSSSQPSRSSGLYNSSCNAYEGGRYLGGNYVYTEHYNRCCGGAPASSYKCYIYNKDSEIKFQWSKNNPGNGWKEYNKNNCGACFGNTKEFKNATKLKWSTKGNEPGYLYMYDVSEDNCKLPPSPPDICKDSSFKDQNKKVEAEICDGETPLEIDETICSGNTSKVSYYSVEIKKKYSTKVDFEEYSTKPGVGFKYNVLLKENRIVNATFDYAKWTKDYNENYDKIQKYKDDNPWYYYYHNVLKSLQNVLKYYNDNYVNWKIDELKKDLSLNITYKLNKKNVNMTFNNFIKDDEQSASNITNKDLKEIKIKTKDGKNFVTYNVSQTINIDTMMIPQKAILDRQRSTISYDNREYDSSLGEVDGGNKIYITSIDSNGNISLSYPDDGEYYIHLMVSMDGNVISNDKCPLYVNSTNLLYRIIDVNNPFINDTYEKGVNWYNVYEDFTGVIRSDTWSLPLKYLFTLDKEDIATIKEDNHSSEGKNKYLGTCYLPNGNSDKGPDIICAKLK